MATDKKQTMADIGKSLNLAGLKVQDIETAIKVIRAVSEKVGTSDKSNEIKVIQSDAYVSANDEARARMIQEARHKDGKKLVQVISLTASNSLTNTVTLLETCKETADKK